MFIEKLSSKSLVKSYLQNYKDMGWKWKGIHITINLNFNSLNTDHTIHSKFIWCSHLLIHSFIHVIKQTLTESLSNISNHPKTEIKKSNKTWPLLSKHISWGEIQIKWHLWLMVVGKGLVRGHTGIQSWGVVGSRLFGG